MHRCAQYKWKGWSKGECQCYPEGLGAPSQTLHVHKTRDLPPPGWWRRHSCPGQSWCHLHCPAHAAHPKCRWKAWRVPGWRGAPLAGVLPWGSLTGRYWLRAPFICQALVSKPSSGPHHQWGSWYGKLVWGEKQDKQTRRTRSSALPAPHSEHADLPSTFPLTSSWVF